MGPTRHLCCLYSTEDQHKTFLTSFIRQGLEQGEKVLYLTDSHSSDLILDYLRAGDHKIESYLASQQLKLISSDDTYLRHGTFDPDRMIATLQAEVDQALAEGYSALRVTGEMSWALRGSPGSERLLEYEAKVNPLLSGNKCLALCQYDRNRFTSEALLNVLATHPIAVMGTEVHENFYYAPPSDFRGTGSADNTLHQWLENLQARKQAEEGRLRQTRMVRLSADISAALAKSNSLREVLQHCADAMVEHLDAALVRVWTLNRKENMLEMQASAGMYAHINGPHGRVPVGQYKIGLIAQERKPHLTNAVVGDPRVHDQEWAKRERLVAFAGYPLTVADQLVGVMAMFARHTLPEDTIYSLASVADGIAQCIERKRMEEEVQRNLERIRALHDINLAVTSTLDLRAVLDVLFKEIDLFLPYAAVTVRLLNRETGELEPIACWNIDEQEWKAATAAGGGLRRMLAEDNAPVMVRNAQTDSRSLASEFLRQQGLVSYLRVPLTAKGQVLGVLTFFTKEEHEFTDEVDFLTMLAGQAAIAIHNSQLHEQTRKQAVELEKASKVKDEFLGFVSHELRTPVNAIIGYTGMIKDGILGGIRPEQEKVLAKVIGRSKNLLGMINSLLEATKVEAGAAKMEMKEVRLGDFLREIRSAYDIPLDRELSLIWDYPSDLPVMKTDREKLRHILENLINNAIKFTIKGCVTFTARHLPESKKVTFKVIDTGIGISRESVPFIFEMFRQVDDSHTRSPSGVGLGLHIVKKFTEMLAGNVEVESQLDKGSTFTVTIPVNG